MNEKKKLIRLISLATLLLSALPLAGDDTPTTPKELEQQTPGYCINFNDVPVIEFIRFVSKISAENFIYDSRDLDFNISFSTGKAVGTEMVVTALIQLLKKHGLAVGYDAGYYVIHNSESEIGDDGQPIKKINGRPFSTRPAIFHFRQSKTANNTSFLSTNCNITKVLKSKKSLKKIAADLRNQPDAPIKLINAIQSLQWVKATNSLLCFCGCRDFAKA